MVFKRQAMLHVWPARLPLPYTHAWCSHKLSHRHIDPHNEGWALTNRAMEATLSSKEAEPLFDRAVERFQEVIAIGYVNWGNVAICRGHRVLDTTAAAGKPLDDALAAEVAAQFDAGEARFKQALDVRPGLFDTLSAFASA